jgi:hypothetical protein
MASFSQLIGRLKAEQDFLGKSNLLDLGIEVEGEKQDVEEARSQYMTDVQSAQREMQRRQQKRSKRGFFGQLLGAGLSLVGVPPGIGAAIGTGASLLGRSSVDPYRANISTSLEGGRFLAQSRKDLSRDIQETNLFIQDAADQQSLLNMTGALADAYSMYNMNRMFTGYQNMKPSTERGAPAPGEEGPSMSEEGGFINPNYATPMVQERKLGG